MTEQTPESIAEEQAQVEADVTAADAANSAAIEAITTRLEAAGHAVAGPTGGWVDDKPVVQLTDGCRAVINAADKIEIYAASDVGLQAEPVEIVEAP